MTQKAVNIGMESSKTSEGQRLYTEQKFFVFTQYNVFIIWNKHIYSSCRRGD